MASQQIKKLQLRNTTDNTKPALCSIYTPYVAVCTFKMCFPAASKLRDEQDRRCCSWRRAAQCRAADIFQVQKKTTRLKLAIHSISLTMCQDHFTNASGNFHFSIRATIVSIVSIATCNLFWTDGEEWFSCSPRINQVCACTDSLKIASCIFWFRSHLLPFTLWGFIF